jgi:hypothetical protein
MVTKIIPIGGVMLRVGLLGVPALAQQQPSGVQGALQGLLSVNQSQDQAVRDAYERGYQRGRQDEARMQRASRNTARPNADEAHGAARIHGRPGAGFDWRPARVNHSRWPKRLAGRSDARRSTVRSLT